MEVFIVPDIAPPAKWAAVCAKPPLAGAAYKKREIRKQFATVIEAESVSKLDLDLANTVAHYRFIKCNSNVF